MATAGCHDFSTIKAGLSGIDGSSGSGGGSGGNGGSDGGSADGPVDGRVPVPLNPACMRPELGTSRALLTEDFEGYPVGAVQPPWVEESTGQTGVVTDSWVHTGVRALLISSFKSPGAEEVIYVKLNVARTPAQLSLELFVAPNGFVTDKMFASFGFGDVASKYDLTRHLSARLNQHTLSFAGEEGGAPAEVFNQIDFASSALMDMTPLYTYVRVEFDFCTSSSRWFVGPDSQAPLTMTLPFRADININALWVSGGINVTVFDDVNVAASGVLD
jgi:hypothetical protein